MNQRFNLGSGGLPVVLCFSLLMNISLAGISPQELEKIEKAVPAKPTVIPKQPRKLLVFNLAEGYRHESIPYCAKAIELMGKKTAAYQIVQSEDMSVFKAENLRQFDAICLNSSSSLKFTDPNLRQGLMDFIKNGKGIIGIHGAINNFQDWPEAAEMMGGIFDEHPWTAEGTWAVRVEDPNHPLATAFKGRDFEINDEIYRIKPINLRTNCRVLLSLDMTKPVNRSAQGVRPADKDVPVSWVRSFGKGRLFYCSLGQNNHIFWNDGLLRHYLDGIQFALGDLPADTAPFPSAP